MFNERLNFIKINPNEFIIIQIKEEYRYRLIDSYKVNLKDKINSILGDYLIRYTDLVNDRVINFLKNPGRICVLTNLIGTVSESLTWRRTPSSPETASRS